MIFLSSDIIFVEFFKWIKFMIYIFMVFILAAVVFLIVNWCFGGVKDDVILKCQEEYNTLNLLVLIEQGVDEHDCYEIAYEGIDGAVTIRKIDIDYVYIKNKRCYIDCYCYLVGDERTFCVDRIISLRLLPDGDCINAIDVFSFFERRYFNINMILNAS